MKNRSNNFDNSGYVCNYALILKTKNKIKNALFTIFANVNFTRDPPHCLPTAQLEEAPGRPHAAQQGPHTAPHHSVLTSGPRLLGPLPADGPGPASPVPGFTAESAETVPVSVMSLASLFHGGHAFPRTVQPHLRGPTARRHGVKIADALRPTAGGGGCPCPGGDSARTARPPENTPAAP